MHQCLGAAVTQWDRVLWAKVSQIQPDVAIPDPHEDLLAWFELAVLQVEAVDLVGDGHGGRQVQLHLCIQTTTPCIANHSG